jgi:hypothetical protein
MENVYCTPEEAREVYGEQHLAFLPPSQRPALTPEFPPGTREYAEFHARLRRALKAPGAFDFLEI